MATMTAENSGTSKAPTIHDVAEHAGVSLSTVSRVLNDYDSVNPQTRENVEAAIKAVKYERSKSEKSKERAVSRAVGLIIPNILNPFFPLLVKGIEQASKIHGYSLVLCDSENDVNVEEQHIKTLCERKVDGIILIPSSETTHVESLQESRLPFVFLDRYLDIEGTSSVVTDNEEGAYQAVKYLLKLGHTRIVNLTGPKTLSTEKSRIRGYQQALAEEQLPYPEELSIAGDYSVDGAYREIKELLRRDVSFSAIFAANDMMAFGARQALKDHGLKVPDDVSLVGYDDILFSSIIALTTVAQPSYEMGKNAILLLLDLIHGRISTPQQIVLRPSMVIRESCQRR
ncbi:MAG: LacI family transcriptional regulator [bacterium]|nr:LacI family transcriptional regulator [bacterium]